MLAHHLRLQVLLLLLPLLLQLLGTSLAAGSRHLHGQARQLLICRSKYFKGVEVYGSAHAVPDVSAVHHAA
jgi:hypothetical protein